MNQQIPELREQQPNRHPADPTLWSGKEEGRLAVAGPSVNLADEW